MKMGEPAGNGTGADDVASHIIRVEHAVTLDGLFRERVRRTPDLVAYKHYDDPHGNWRDYTWRHMERMVARWQAALRAEGLQPGDRVAVMLRNCPEWAAYDIAALGLGLIVVPVYTQDRAENVAYILNHAECRVLLFETEEQWRGLAAVRDELSGLRRIVTLRSFPSGGESRLVPLSQWLPDEAEVPPAYGESRGDELATIVYTSGTTGRPKGVMLSHRNILTNAHACLIGVLQADQSYMFMSFLPLSHTFERTCGYYLPMMCGAPVAYARSVQQLGDDLRTLRPQVLVSVPRIYERIWATVRDKLQEGPRLRRALFHLAVDVGYAHFQHKQGRARWRPSLLLWPLLRRLVSAKILSRLGGELRVALSGGAALSPEVSRIFIGLGLPVIQGYGLTESSPVVCANRLEDNVPESVGQPIPGIEIRVADSGALEVRGPNVMLGYWKNPEATRAVVDEDGWLSTGDLVHIDSSEHVYITGRLKDILVLSNGEKISPTDLEAAVLGDPLFEQVMLVGEGRPYLTLVAVLSAERWDAVSRAAGMEGKELRERDVERMVLKRVASRLKNFPGYLQVRRLVLTREPWTVENGMLTPTLKLKRESVLTQFNAEIDRLYAGM
ncbi:MAG TPA: long-chain fatty acid--CoA ligase [Burkholderiales bacterium]|nr:long-chain fatty acid--CoA ligase [Burkholderiales bacterium]